MLRSWLLNERLKVGLLRVWQLQAKRTLGSLLERNRLPLYRKEVIEKGWVQRKADKTTKQLDVSLKLGFLLPEIGGG